MGPWLVRVVVRLREMMPVEHGADWGRLTPWG